MATVTTRGFELQEQPKVYVTTLPGHWLLKRTTPSWRIKDPKKGFQRVVKEARAKEIAVAVLDQNRTFPNAIVLATDVETFGEKKGELSIPTNIRFLVVDGQHRLWAQEYSAFEARYACVIHMGLSEVEMAYLFLEINDNQKRVPSSLRWDLVRLVRPEDDPYAVKASDLVYQLATEERSPLYQRIDLTGEVNELKLKQGSLAPEIKTLVSTKKAGLRDLVFETQYDVLVRYLAAIRSLDTAGWRSSESPFYKARVLRVLLKLLPELAAETGKPAAEISSGVFREYLERIDKASLADENIRAAQGSAGMKEIYDLIKKQLRIK